MSLDYDISKIADEVKWIDGKLSATTEAMIFSTMAVGIGEITEKNAAEYYARLSLWEATFSAYRTHWDGTDADPVSVPFTPQDVRNHIGLHTNVFPKVPDSKWIKTLWENRKNEGMRRYKRETSPETTD